MVVNPDWPHNAALNVSATCLERGCKGCGQEAIGQWNDWSIAVCAMLLPLLKRRPHPESCGAMAFYHLARMAHRLRSTADIYDRYLAMLVDDPEARAAMIVTACEDLPDRGPGQ